MKKERFDFQNMQQQLSAAHQTILRRNCKKLLLCMMMMMKRKKWLIEMSHISNQEALCSTLDSMSIFTTFNSCSSDWKKNESPIRTQRNPIDKSMMALDLMSLVHLLQQTWERFLLHLISHVYHRRHAMIMSSKRSKQA